MPDSSMLRWYVGVIPVTLRNDLGPVVDVNVVPASGTTETCPRESLRPGLFACRRAHLPQLRYRTHVRYGRDPHGFRTWLRRAALPHQLLLPRRRQPSRGVGGGG